ncbi:MAG TPA: SagB family peptide dehydrogenase [Burkholderiaceae bacterium]|nr:SagB family peptide dehydrogenase [Burkholderiaceae bacterium]
MSTSQDTVRAYHERSKHQLRRYAAGPETLDWDAQPDPFRRWAGSSLTMLPLVAASIGTTWSELHGDVAPLGISRETIGALFELSFGLTAWKQLGPDRWALRANPSSGNLHPTEAYLLAAQVRDLADGLYHYAPKEHALELRTPLVASDPNGAPQLWIGLSSICWREAWKYGERAFRYCQLDTGHALGALRYAAATLGWQARVVTHIGHAELAALLGLDREMDFGTAEAEEPEVLVQIGPHLPLQLVVPRGWTNTDHWQGRANRLDVHPMYRWPVIEEVAVATRDAGGASPADSTPEPSRPAQARVAAKADRPAVELILQRRSAQHFESAATMSMGAFLRIVESLQPCPGLPWDTMPSAPLVHAVMYVHRVDGLPPGAYVLPRSASGADLLSGALTAGRAWEAVSQVPPGVPLQRLASPSRLAETLRTLSCHQAIARDACFAVSLVAEVGTVFSGSPSGYRQLFRECGLIGQVLYLSAEAEGYRGTGIGCYFDDAVHEFLGLADQRLQVLYHFTVGMPLSDTRISLEPPYADRSPITAPHDALAP